MRPLASPIPLAFFAFGVGSFLQSVLQLGWIPEDEARNVALILGAFVAPAQFVAAIFSFSWLGTSLVTYLSAPDTTSGAWAS